MLKNDSISTTLLPSSVKTGEEGLDVSIFSENIRPTRALLAKTIAKKVDGSDVILTVINSEVAADSGNVRYSTILSARLRHSKICAVFFSPHRFVAIH